MKLSVKDVDIELVPEVEGTVSSNQIQASSTKTRSLNITPITKSEGSSSHEESSGIPDNREEASVDENVIGDNVAVTELDRNQVEDDEPIQDENKEVIFISILIQIIQSIF